jgi:hypothetical protein
MKKLIMFLGIFTVTLSAFAQQDDEFTTEKSNEIKTLMGKNNTVGGYAALSMQYSQIADKDAFVFGARGGIMLGHLVTLGLGGSGFFNEAYRNETTQEDISLAGGYGGFFFEPVIMPKSPVHVSFPILIGAGGVSVVNSNNDNDLGNIFDDEYDSNVSDAFMVIEPGIEVEMNVTRFFRFCVGVTYRYTTDVDFLEEQYADISSDVLRGISGGVTFKFGKF